MAYKNSAFSASEGKIFSMCSIGIIIITVLCAVFPPLGEVLRAGLLWAGAFLFGIPYMLIVLYIVKEAINDLLKATGTDLKIDTDELARDLKEIFFVDRAEAILEEKRKKKAKDEDDLIQEMIFMDDDDGK